MMIARTQSTTTAALALLLAVAASSSSSSSFFADAFTSSRGGHVPSTAFVAHRRTGAASTTGTALRYRNSNATDSRALPIAGLGGSGLGSGSVVVALTEEELRLAESLEKEEEEKEKEAKRRQEHHAADPIPINDDPETTALRTTLKKQLAQCSIENYDYNNYGRGQEKAGLAEDIMKQLELVRPWASPASDPQLNARFSFVFTGVPTIGMKLITLLSRISVGFPVVDFRDVFLEVSCGNSKAKAIVTANVFGMPMELNVLTDLDVDETHPEGTMMIETFDKITLQGWTVPTPESWSRARTLEITYLDDDMMIARTAGGEPHFLLRHSTCSTDDDSCDVDMELTAYFEEARAKYGEQIARCLVDRDYGRENECGERMSDANPWATVLSFQPGSLFGGGDRDR